MATVGSVILTRRILSIVSVLCFIGIIAIIVALGWDSKKDGISGYIIIYRSVATQLMYVYIWPPVGITCVQCTYSHRYPWGNFQVWKH